MTDDSQIKKQIVKRKNIANRILEISCIIGLFVTAFYNLGFGLIIALLGLCTWILIIFIYGTPELY